MWETYMCFDGDKMLLKYHMLNGKLHGEYFMGDNEVIEYSHGAIHERILSYYTNNKIYLIVTKIGNSEIESPIVKNIKHGIETETISFHTIPESGVQNT